MDQRHRSHELVSIDSLAEEAEWAEPNYVKQSSTERGANGKLACWEREEGSRRVITHSLLIFNV